MLDIAEYEGYLIQQTDAGDFAVLERTANGYYGAPTVFQSESYTECEAWVSGMAGDICTDNTEEQYDDSYEAAYREDEERRKQIRQEEAAWEESEPSWFRFDDLSFRF